MDQKTGSRPVEKLRAGSPLQKAGLAVGDVILAIDGNKIADAESLRRRLRRAFVHQETSLIVSRSEKTQEIRVSFVGFKPGNDD